MARCNAPIRGHRGDVSAQNCPVHRSSTKAKSARVNALRIAEPQPVVDVHFHDNGSVSGRWWMLDGHPHRTDGPSVIEYYDDGSVSYEGWHIEGRRHRDDGPSEVHYDHGGNIFQEMWHQHGEQHREDGPALVYKKSGALVQEVWIIHDCVTTKRLVCVRKANRLGVDIDEHNDAAFDFLDATPMSEWTEDLLRLARELHPDPSADAAEPF